MKTTNSHPIILPLLVTALFAQHTATVAASALQAKAGNPLSFLDNRLIFDIQERVRVEVRENTFDFNDAIDSINDDGWLLQRFRLGMNIQPINWLNLYAQIQDVREWDSDRDDFPGAFGAEGDDAFDLRQAYMEIGDARRFPLTLKMGRQVLAYGDERLIGPLDWNNISRTFDALKLRFEQPGWWIDLFASSVVTAERGSYNQSDLFNGNETHREQVFSGLYFSTTALPFQTTDIYALHLHEDTRQLPISQNNDTNFFTFGTRIKSNTGYFANKNLADRLDGKTFADGKSLTPQPAQKTKGLDYDAEVAFQTGEVQGRSLCAWAAHAGIGYTFDLLWKPRISIEYSYASGDENPFDDDIQTFQNLFPTNHKFYGYMDLFAWTNVHNPALNLKFAPHKNLTVELNGHVFFAATNEDAWYRANGVTPVRPVNRDADTFEGTEFDATVTWRPVSPLALQVGYSHFWAGDFLKATGRNDDAQFLYTQATLEF